MIVAFAGRRVDKEAAGGNEPGAFPLANVERVRRDAERFLADGRPAAVVGSAACGADLIVLEAAGRLGIRRRVVLPFDPATFRTTSVTDRPGDWGPVFDDVIEALAAGDLIEMGLDADDSTAYMKATIEIFEQCEALLPVLEAEREPVQEPLMALILWNGEARPTGDLTEAFLNEAKRREWPSVQILTNGDDQLRR